MKMSKSLITGIKLAGAFVFATMFVACVPELPSVLDPLGVTQSSSSSGGGGGGNNDNGGRTETSETLAPGGSYAVLNDGTSAGRKAVTAPTTPGDIKIGATSYDTIQAALTAAKSAGGAVTITLGKGTYNVTGLTYDGSNDVKISGQGNAEYGLDVVIYGQGSNMSNEKGRSTLAIAGSGNIILENLTIQSPNTTESGNHQSEVIGTDGTGNLAAYNCSFLSGQDTLRTVAKAWFYKCYIEGDVDFTWMEYTGGVVALYEECVLRAIGTRTSTAYFTAPRLGLTSKVGKGLVIYNSTLEAERGLTALYLGRNPWSSTLSDYYEQVAIIGSKLYLADGVTLHSDVWASQANGTRDQKYIGFKTDDYFPAGKYGTRIGSEFISQEYAGRENILNRLYSTSASKFVKDSDGYWDIAKVISDNNWTVTADTSSSLLAGETEVVTKVYDFSTADAGAYADSSVTLDGFSKHGSSANATGGEGNTITISLTGKAVVTVKGDYSGWGTIKAGSQGEGVYDANSGSTSKYLESTYVVYDSGATSVVITAATSTYINSITVEYDDSLSYTAVAGISVASSTDNPTVGVAAKMTATVTPDSATNASVKWTSSDTAVGTIDEYSGEVKFLKAGSVTFTATARDGSGQSGNVTLSPEAATWTSAEWYDSKDSSSTATSGSGTGLGGAAGTNNSVFGTGSASGVALGSVKTVTLIDGTSASISTGLKGDANGKITFSVTKSAKVKVMAGYCSGANVTNDTCEISSSDGGNATADSSNPTAIPTADATYIWTLTAGTYTVGRKGSGYAPAIYYVRVDLEN